MRVTRAFSVALLGLLSASLCLDIIGEGRGGIAAAVAAAVVAGGDESVRTDGKMNINGNTFEIRQQQQQQERKSISSSSTGSSSTRSGSSEGKNERKEEEPAATCSSSSPREGVDACSSSPPSSSAAGNVQRQDLHRQQQQQQQQPGGEGGEDGPVAVETGKRDGISIEFIGKAEGKIERTTPSPPLDREAARESLLANERGNGVPRPLGYTSAEDGLELKFDLLRCDGDSYSYGSSGGGEGGGGGLTVKGVCDHMLNKLVESVHQIAPNAGDAPRKVSNAIRGEEKLANVEGAAPANAYLVQALAIVTSPLSYLFGTLGGVPGWFSDTVFEVSLKEGVSVKDLPQRLVLVQDPPRSLRLACSLITPLYTLPVTESSSLRSGSSTSTAKPTTEEGTVAAAIATARRVAATMTTALDPYLSTLPALARKLCHEESPFSGKAVSRPCTIETARGQQQQQQPRGWVSSALEMALFSVGLGVRGGRGEGTSISSWVVRSETCECKTVGEGGVSSCTVKAPPGRDPCLFVEVDNGSTTTRRRWGVGSEKKEIFDAASADAFSSVQLRTYLLDTSFAAPVPTAGKNKEKAKAGSDTQPADTNGVPLSTKIYEKEGVLAGGLEVLQAAAVERGLLPPSSVNVPVYVARLVAGVVLLLLAQPLSESRMFHYLLSALLGGVVGVVGLVLRAIGNPQRTFIRLLLLTGIVTWMGMAMGGDFVPSPAELCYALPGTLLVFWRVGLAGYPMAGKAFFAFSGLAGVFITRWQGLFLDEGDGPSRGSWLNGQACIRRVLTLSGILQVYYGVSDAEIGMALVMLALMTPTLAHYARRYTMWSNRSKWYRAGNRLSQSEYERQGDEYTRQALGALRATTAEDWSLVKKLKNQASRKRMTSFAQTGEHIASPRTEGVGARGSCTLQ